MVHSAGTTSSKGHDDVIFYLMMSSCTPANFITVNSSLAYVDVPS